MFKKRLLLLATTITAILAFNSSILGKGITAENSNSDDFNEYEESIWKHPELSTEDFSYKVSQNDTVAITKYEGEDKEVAIPDKINGRNVTDIWQDAFSNKDITSVKIPSTVKNIDLYAFWNCFKLASIEVAENNPNYLSIDGVLYNKNKTALLIYPPSKEDSEFLIYDSVNEIKATDFLEYSNLAYIKVSENNLNYTSIDGVLYNKDKTALIAYPPKKQDLKLSIPDSVNEIKYSTFLNCYNLNSIEVSKNNANYLSIDGILYSKDKETLLVCPKGNKRLNLIIPDGVLIIKERAFENCLNLVSLIMPNSILRVEASAFKNCQSLVSITMSNNISGIESYTFLNCTSLTSITIPNMAGVISNKAFSNCYNLALVTASSTVGSIAEDAFDNCHKDLLIICESGSNFEYYAKNKNIPFKLKTSKTLDGLYYAIYENTVSITKYEGNRANISIPAAIEGVPVVTIRYDAFSNCTSLTQITIPSSVKYIQDNAFLGCPNLNSIKVSENNPDYSSKNGVLYNKDKTVLIAYPPAKQESEFLIPDSVTEVKRSVFRNCYNLTCIKVSENNSKYSSENGMLFNKTKTSLIICPKAKQESELLIPNGTLTIEPTAFSDCINLASITVPSSVQVIEQDAFLNCFGLSSIKVSKSNPNYSSIDGVLYSKSGTVLIAYPPAKQNSEFLIPDSVVDMAYPIFVGCNNITSIKVSENNPNYSSDSGVLFNKNKTILIFCPRAKQQSELLIPDSTLIIERNAFSNCSGLISIVIPNGVASIREYAFSNCSNLKSITIPNSVTYVGEYAFSGCTNLKSAEVSNDVKVIKGYTFSECASLMSITIPDGVLAIKDYAFSGCKSLTSIEIPNSAIDIEPAIFSDCFALKTITVPANIKPIYEKVLNEPFKHLVVVK